MRWALAMISSLLIISSALLRPVSIHLGYQVIWKEEVCGKALNILRDRGYRLLIRGTLESELGAESDIKAELTEHCNSFRQAYCLVIPGTSPLKFLKVERG
ncbi:MAG: hypothetical protein QW576_06370 [Candidatus Korarchaeum sp.]